MKVGINMNGERTRNITCNIFYVAKVNKRSCKINDIMRMFRPYVSLRYVKKQMTSLFNDEVKIAANSYKNIGGFK